MYSQTMPKESSKSVSSYSNLIKNVVIGTIIGLFSVIALLFVFAVIINNTFDDPMKNLDIFICAATALGAFLGGFFASAKNAGKGFICGLMTGFSMSLILFFIMIVLGTKKENDYFVFYLVNILFQILFACAGGIIAVNRRNGKKSKKSRSR